MNTRLFFSNNAREAKKLSGLFKKGQLRRLRGGIYTSDLTSPVEQVIRQNWMQIVATLVPEGTLSFRTAIELKTIPYRDNVHIVFVTSSYEKTLKLPGLIIKIYKGNRDLFVEQVLPNLTRTVLARTLLENFIAVRKPAFKGLKNLSHAEMESYLAKELRVHDEKGLNEIREQAKKIADTLNLPKQFTQLNEMIRALLASHPDENYLKTDYAKAIIKKEPFDQHRLKLFEELYHFIKKATLKQRAYTYQASSFRNLSFFESYFSNFIEGTEFIIDEAEDIVFSGIEINNRHADSHDVLSHFYLSNDFNELSKTPQSPSDLVNILKARHAFLMKERPEKLPGQFKNQMNKAGNSYFVAPQDVIGTLTQAYELYKLLNKGLSRALFLHFIISEIHPFNDGNGRIARIMMNAELVPENLYKIIIPTAHRDNYLMGLRRASRDHFFQTYCKVMDQSQAYTASIDWLDYPAAREKLENDAADKHPDEGLPQFNRALRELTFSEFTLS